MAVIRRSDEGGPRARVRHPSGVVLRRWYADPSDEHWEVHTWSVMHTAGRVADALMITANCGDNRRIHRPLRATHKIRSEWAVHNFLFQRPRPVPKSVR